MYSLFTASPNQTYKNTVFDILVPDTDNMKEFSDLDIKLLSNISDEGRNIIIFTIKLKEIMMKSVISYD